MNFLGPYQYYRYLRGQGLKPRSAGISALMRFCPTGEEFRIRAKRVSVVLNKIDRRRKGQA